MAPEPSNSLSLLDRLFARFEELRASDRLIITLLAVIAFTSLLIGGIRYAQSETVTVPVAGGVLTEGIIGTPRFVNPILGLTRADTDMIALVYSGLLRLAPDGTLTPDLAESVTVSDDGLVYNIVLRDDVTFHDGTPIDSADVTYTIEEIQNPTIKSPLRGNWSGVTVEVISDRELNIILTEPYAPFIENLTLGILPRHIWEPIDDTTFSLSQHNTIPIGSGPYQIESVSRDKAGLINGYTLSPHTGDGRRDPGIRRIEVLFFANNRELRDALMAGDVTSSADLSRESISALLDSNTDFKVVMETLPRTAAVFFNQNDSVVLRDEAVRAALTASIDRNALIEDALNGFGAPTDSPIPAGFETGTSTEVGRISATSNEAVREILVDGGWTFRDGEWQKEIDDDVVPLTFTLATANSAPFTDVASALREIWAELDITVSVELYEQGDLVQQVVRPRDFDALLFGTEVGRALDLYPFWHSSQREDPGLNITRYANITTDTALEEIRATQDSDTRATALANIVDTLTIEQPAIFLYSPVFTYILNDHIHTPEMNGIARSSERFSNITHWYVRSENVWPFFKDLMSNRN